MNNTINSIEELPAIPLSLRNKLPDESGIYFVTSRDIILYIGKAKNLRERWDSTTHHRHEQLQQFENPQLRWFLTDEIDATEVIMIKQFNPLLNGVSVPKSVVEGVLRQRTEAIYKASNKRLSAIQVHLSKMVILFEEYQSLNVLSGKATHRALSRLIRLTVNHIVHKEPNISDIEGLTDLLTESNSLESLECSAENRFINEFKVLLTVYKEL